jgi:hypothetical protein
MKLTVRKIKVRHFDFCTSSKFGVVTEHVHAAFLMFIFKKNNIWLGIVVFLGKEFNGKDSQGRW